MQYALLIYTQPDALASLSEAEWAEDNKEYWAIRAVPGVSTGAGLQPVETATTVRRQDGQTLVTDGPFADTKEVLAGFFLYEADNLDQATELAARMPAVRIGGSIEIRPVMDH
jgi:hypothetical protein